MPSAAVVSAVLAKIDAGFPHAPRLVANESGQFQVPIDGSAYLSIPVWASSETPITVGSPGKNQNEEVGAFHIELNVPLGSGLDTVTAWIDQIKALFRQQQFAGITITGFGNDAMTTDSADGLYFVAFLAVSYQYHFIG